MSIDIQKIRIEGIYQQRQEGYFMQRAKLPAGVLSTAQANCIADTADKFGRGLIHLTSRGSMEIHWLKADDLQSVKQEFAKTGLTSRGACGGAVRGISCSSQNTLDFPQLESVARRLHLHFTANPRFEGLPKKFKICIEADASSGRHLIQDVGLVMTKNDREGCNYDVWIAGGLGREPRAGFLFEAGVAEERIIPVIEAVANVYARLAPPPKRLKFLAAQLGENELRRLIIAEPSYGETFLQRGVLTDNLTQASPERKRLVFQVFAGQLTSAELRSIAAFASKHAEGVLQVTADQNIAFSLPAGADTLPATAELAELGSSHSPEAEVTFRVCPGNHECKMGLAATRDIAKVVINSMSPDQRISTWALSGCANSCTQPQLADLGIVTAKLTGNPDGTKAPLFDLYHRTDDGLGTRFAEGITLEDLQKHLHT